MHHRRTLTALAHSHLEGEFKNRAQSGYVIANEYHLNFVERKLKLIYNTQTKLYNIAVLQIHIQNYTLKLETACVLVHLRTHLLYLNFTLH